MDKLLDDGLDIDDQDNDGAGPLHYAAQVGAMQTVKLLIKYEVDVNAADNEGWTPLHIAVQSRNRDIVKVLLVNGADKTRRTKDGITPLDLSLCFGKDFKSFDIAKLLKFCTEVKKPAEQATANNRSLDECVQHRSANKQVNSKLSMTQTGVSLPFDFLKLKRRH
ncbi:hypothetical protein NC651_002994 [Populus alba x Populus x berolinensis]|nr:hypothetical protein NC651_002994 [Populus alba x Populus x berolinensis]